MTADSPPTSHGTKVHSHAPSEVEGRTPSPSRTASRRRRGRRRRFLLLGIGAFLLLLVGVLADGYLQALHYGQELRALFPALQAARHDFLKGGDQARLDQVERRVEDLRKGVDHARFTFALTGLLPYVGRPVDAVRLGADAAGHAAAALSIGRDVWLSIVGHEGDQALLRNGQVNLAMLEGLEPKTAAILGELRAAQRDISAIPHIPFVGRIDVLREEALAQTREAIVSGARALQGVKVLPTLLGADGPRTYFLALQNNADLRGTGGAVLGWGILRVDRGRISLVDGGGITEIEGLGAARVSMPPAIRWYLRTAHVHPRINNGANYSPNFPLVAKTWAKMIGRATGQPITDVIALDPVGVAALMKGQGTFRIPGYDRPLGANNVSQFTEHDQYKLPPTVQVALPSQLVAAAFQALSSPKDLLGLSRSVSTAISEKRIQLWSSDKRARKLLRAMRWDGRIRPSEGDYLYLTDNKRLSNKVDYFTRTSIDDTVTIDRRGDARVDVLITLDNQTPPGEPQIVSGKWSRYALNVAMLDLYVPLSAGDPVVDPAVGVDFDTHPQGFVIHHEAGRRVFTKIITATPGHPGTLRFRYSIPDVIRETPEGKVYDLMVQHQPLVHPAELTVKVVLPPGSDVTRVGDGWTVEEGGAAFRATLTRDLETSVVYR